MSRMWIGWAGVAFMAAFVAVVYAAQFKVGHIHLSHTHTRVSHTCAHVGCITIGDTVTLTLHGKVTSVQDPQAGVRCVQVQSSNSAGDYCERYP